MHEDFAANLRLLCSYYRSIAEVCRRLDINRPQFNRYLSGRYKPAANTLRQICDFFGLETDEILLPHVKFKQLIQQRPQSRSGVADARAAGAAILPENVLTQGSEELARYLGHYHEYYMSMSRPGFVLRTLIHLYRQGDRVVYQRIERMPPHEGGKVFHNRYVGVATFLTDRIFMFDYESINGYEMTQTILFPSFKSRVTRLTGLKMGVADNSERMPCCVRVLYERVDDRLSPRQALAQCGLLPRDDSSLSPSILNAIGNEMAPDNWHFRARY